MKLRIRLDTNNLTLCKWLFWGAILFSIFNWGKFYSLSNEVERDTTYFASSPVPHEYLKTSYISMNTNVPVRKIDKISLEDKYRLLGGVYYAENMKPYLPAIDKVLSENELDYNEKFIKGMFYVGQQESHWAWYRVSRFKIKNGHPTGIFQFLPGTFRSVSDGYIFDAEDQIRAFVTMWKRSRTDEFAVMFKCNYPPCLDQEIKRYMLFRN